MPTRAILLSAVILLSVVAFFALVIGLGAARLSASLDDDTTDLVPAPAARPAPRTAVAVPLSTATTVPSTPPPVAAPGRPIFAAEMPERPGHVVLAAREALVHGKRTKIHKGKKPAEAFVGSWRDGGDYAEWSAVVPPAGGYAVELTYACDKGAGGEFELVIGDRIIAGRAEQTGKNGSMVSLGAVEVPAGQARVLLRPAGPVERELMKLRRIELFPLDAGEFALARKADVKRADPGAEKVAPPAAAVAAIHAVRPGPPGARAVPLAGGAAGHPAAAPVPATLAEPVFLPARLAGLHGSEIRLDAHDDDATEQSIGFWRDPEEHVEWVVRLDRPARYHVVLSYACAAGHGGDFVLTSAGKPLKGRVKGEGTWDDRRTVTLGTIALPAGDTPLILKPARPMPDGRALMNCHGLLLLPAGE